MKRIRRMAREPTVAALLLASAAFAGVYGLRWAGALQWIELFVYDRYVGVRAFESPTEQRVVTIGVMEDEISQHGWPLADGVLADILARVLALEPAAVGVDIYRDQPVGDGHERLAELLRTRQEIYWVSKFREGAWEGIAPPAALDGTGRTGFSDVMEDSAGIVRRGLLYLDDQQTSETGFALRLALAYLARHGVTPGPSPDNPDHLALGKVSLVPFEANDGGYVRADANGYQILLDFKRGPGTPPFYSVSELLAGTIRPAEIRDKVVIIGVTAESVKDYFYTPLSRDFRAEQTMFGSVLHGEIVGQLIRHGLDGVALTRSLSERQEALWIFLWALLGAALARLSGTLLSFAAVLAGFLAALVIISLVAFDRAWWIPVVPPALVALVSAGLVTSLMSYRARAERANLMQLFSSHVSGRIAEQIWRQRDEFMEHGRPKPQELVATVLFTDIKGFTSVSENLSEVQLIEWLNAYLERMADVVMSHGGIVDKFIGDAVMAVFGVPLPHSDPDTIAADARAAARCALDMARELEHLNIDLAARGLPVIGIRAGIHSGQLVAGSVGGANRLEYTVVGDTVNIAARLESNAGALLADAESQYPCDILVSEATVNWLDEEFITRPVGPVALKGKVEQIEVYHLVGLAKSGARTEVA